MSRLPSLDEPYALDPGSIDSYRRDGHVILRGLATPEELAPFRPALTNSESIGASNRYGV